MKRIMLTAAMAALLAGCNAQLDEFRRIELGKPLPESVKLGATTKRAEGVQASSRHEVIRWPLPSIASAKSIGVVVDGSGRVIAKRYGEFSMEHWLLAQAGAMDWRMEMLVPEDVFVEAATRPTDGYAQDRSTARGIARYAAEMAADVDSSLRAQWAPDPPWSLAVNFPFAMFVGGRTTWPDGLQWKGKDFEGVTREGFDRTIDFRDGGRAHIRNLGGRKVLVEFQFFRVVDPLFLIPMVECFGPAPAPVERTTTIKSK